MDQDLWAPRATDQTELPVDPAAAATSETPPTQANDLLRAQFWRALRKAGDALRDDEPETEAEEPKATPNLLRAALGINLSDLARQPAAGVPLLLNALADLRELLAGALAEEVTQPNADLPARLTMLSTALQQAGYANAAAIATLPQRLRTLAATDAGRAHMAHMLAQLDVWLS